MDAEAVSQKAEPSPAEAMAEGMRMAQQMQEAAARGENPSEVIAKMTQSSAGAGIDWTKDIEGADGVADTRYVVLDEKAMGGKHIPTRVVAVYTDEILGGTAIALRRVPDVGMLANRSTDIDTLERRQRIMALLAQPDD